MIVTFPGRTHLLFVILCYFFQKTREGSDDEDGATGGGKGSDSDSSSSSDEDVSRNAEYSTTLLKLDLIQPLFFFCLEKRIAVG